MKSIIIILVAVSSCIETENGVIGEDSLATEYVGYTHEDARDFAEYMADRYGFEIRKRRFGKRSVAIRDLVFFTFEPGDATRTPWSQIKSVIHESQHVRQWRRNDTHSIEYATSSRYRAESEVEAWQREMFADWTVQRAVYGAKKYLRKLENYECDANDFEFARETLDDAYYSILDGDYVDQDMDAVIGWLQQRGEG